MLGVILSPARFEVLTAVGTKVTVFGDMTPCSLVQMFWVKNALLLSVDHFLLSDYTALQDSVVGTVTRLRSGRPWSCGSTAGTGKTLVSFKHPNELFVLSSLLCNGCGRSFSTGKNCRCLKLTALRMNWMVWRSKMIFDEDIYIYISSSGLAATFYLVK
jgi:hypothetical protein